MYKKASCIAGTLLLLFLVVMAFRVGGTAAEGTDFEEYVWWISPQNSEPPSDLVAELEGEVAAIVEAGHLAPYYYERGVTSREGVGGGQFWIGNVVWSNPADIIYTLSYAYPYLSSELQGQVRTYLAQELESYPPFEQLGFPGYVWIMDGTRREPYKLFPIHGADDLNVWPIPPEPIENPPALVENLYAIWAYAHATGDWQYVSDHWTEIGVVYNANKGAVSYGAIAGVIGYARMAEQLGFHATAQSATQRAVSKMEAGLDFDFMLTTANQAYPDPKGYHSGWRAPVFFYLTPEIGRYLGENAAWPVQQYLEAFTADNANSVWYITKAGAQREWGENSYHGPEKAWSIFMAEAYIMGDYREELQGYLDIPLCLGDLYYIQKLVATINAASSVGDSTPPVISDVDVSSVGLCSATFTWKTDEPATSQVEYGRNTSYGAFSRTIRARVTSHMLTVMLRPSTIYHFRVRSTSAGGSAMSQDHIVEMPEGSVAFMPFSSKAY